MLDHVTPPANGLLYTIKNKNIVSVQIQKRQRFLIEKKIAVTQSMHGFACITSLNQGMGRSFGVSVIIYLKKLHFHAPIGALSSARFILIYL